MADDPLSSGSRGTDGHPADADADSDTQLAGPLNGQPTHSHPDPTDLTHTPHHAPTTSTSIAAGPSSGGFTVIRGNGGYDDWEAEYERQKEQAWGEKVDKDLEGWRGGMGRSTFFWHGLKLKPRSAYQQQALPRTSYFHQPVTGTIGRHLPKEVIRVERDWTGGEVCQFETTFPMELEGRIKPAHFTSFITTLNTHLCAAYAVGPTVLDNVIAVASLWTSLLWRKSTFERGLGEVEKAIQEANDGTFNPQGLNVLSPRDVALQFLEIEYY